MKAIIRKSSALACGSIVLIAAAAAVLSQRSSALAAMPDLSGTYALRSKMIESDLENYRAAIRRASVDLHPRDAVIWRAIVELIAIPEARLRLSRARGTLSVSRGTEPALVSSDRGQARSLDGGHRLVQRIEGRELVQRLETISILGVELETPMVTTARHTLSADGKTLTVETRIEGGAFTRAMTFESTYDRI